MDEILPGSPTSGESDQEAGRGIPAEEPQTALSPTDGATPFYVVGVGASAGGLEALESFFQRMPADAGLAFVVIQHLSPDFKSLMDELLSRRTEIAIRRVESGMAVEPNAIYLIPPKKEMIISGGRLLLTDKDPATGLSLPIDTFFRSLAQDLGERAVGIVLSGTGSDGSRGIRAIHEAGGLVIVQSEETAKFDGMPRSAIETGVVDLVLPPTAMSQALLDYVESPQHGPGRAASRDPSAFETGMNAVYSLLRSECGIDFSHFKPNTVLRRIDRRLQLNRSFDLDEYVEQLRSDRRELNSLYRDLLIGVTRFFRDPELFELLENDAIPELLSKISDGEEIRVWVAGCATGEEAYSLAMLFHEALNAARRAVSVKIFATDVHRASLEFASAGVYDAAALTEVPAPRLERYFTPHAAGYRILPDLRKMIVFAPHNVIKDAPFTKLDLISCRNLLIYLKTNAQKKALSLFHFGLKTGGVLVLGPSESPGEVGEEFQTLDSHWKIYRKRRDVRLPTDMRMPLSPLLPQVQAAGATLKTSKSALPDPNLIKAYDELLGACVPPSFLVNLQRELLHTFAGAGRFLRVPDGIFLDRNLQIRKFTPKISLAFQLLPQDIGRRIDSFAHNIAYDGLLDDVRRVLETEEPFERDVQDRFGEWFLLRILPYRTKAKVEGVVATLIEISRLKATEQELRRLSKVFMDGADPIIIEDLSGRIIDLNREAERAYGWSRDELLGQSVSMLVSPEHKERFKTLREKCRMGESVRNAESVRRDRRGNATHVLLTLSLLHDEEGQAAAIASISKDISAQKQAEVDARDAANRRDQFLAMLSHELRNPLGALLNATRLANRPDSDDAARRRACEAIERQSKQMARLLDDLLDVSRVTQGKIHIRSEPVDLALLADEAVQVVQPLIESREHVLNVDLPDRPVYVEGDPARLLQVQENLLQNAAKYTPPGGEIRLSLREEHDDAVLCIRDNGVGIAPDMQARIFDLFVQAPAEFDRTDAGMGIGLTLVRSLVQLHHGRISLRSEGLGKGTEFEVRLPLSSKRPAPSGANEVPRNLSVKILIVEDNVDSREMLASLLRLDGYEVVAAPDGVRGFEAIAAERPDVALIDIGLPGIDGYEVARKVRRELVDGEIRLVALTGYGRSVDRDAVFAAGFDEHLVKPVEVEEVVRVLRKAR